MFHYLPNTKYQSFTYVFKENYALTVLTDLTDLTEKINRLTDLTVNRFPSVNWQPYPRDTIEPVPMCRKPLRPEFNEKHYLTLQEQVYYLGICDRELTGFLYN